MAVPAKSIIREAKPIEMPVEMEAHPEPEPEEPPSQPVPAQAPSGKVRRVRKVKPASPPPPSVVQPQKDRPVKKG